MRKFLYIIFALICIFNINLFCKNSTLDCNFFAESDIYFRVSAENTTLFRTATDSYELDNIYFTLPTTYFVLFLSDENENFLKVSYCDIIGYVLKADVTRVYSTPTTPYFTQTFSVLNTANPVVYSLPSSTSTYLGNIPFNANNVICYGITSGDESSNNNLWYYCKYLSFEQGILTGYIHSSLTTNLSEFVENTEVVDMEPSQTTSSQILAPELNNKTNILLILGLSIPALLLLILVFKPEKRKQKTEAKRQITALNKLALRDKNSQDELDF